MDKSSVPVQRSTKGDITCFFQTTGTERTNTYLLRQKMPPMRSNIVTITTVHADVVIVSHVRLNVEKMDKSVQRVNVWARSKTSDQQSWHKVDIGMNVLYPPIFTHCTIHLFSLLSPKPSTFGPSSGVFARCDRF